MQRWKHNMEYVALFFVYLPSDERCKAAAGVSPVQFLFKFSTVPSKINRWIILERAIMCKNDEGGLDDEGKECVSF